MKIHNFDDTDTLYSEFRAAQVTTTQDLDDDTLLDLDGHGNVVAITMEHASERADIRKLSLEGLVA